MRLRPSSLSLAVAVGLATAVLLSGLASAPVARATVSRSGTAASSIGKVIGTIPMGANVPGGIAVDSANGDLYVETSTYNGTYHIYRGGLELIDGTTNAIIGTISVDTGLESAALTNGSNGDIYVASTGTQNVSVIDGATNRVVATIPFAPGAPNEVVYSLVFDSSNGDVYILGGTGYPAEEYNVAIVDPSASAVTGTIPLGTVVSPGQIAFDPVNGDLYVTSPTWAGGNVSVIDGATNRVVDTIPFDSSIPWAIAADSSDGDLYVGTGGSVPDSGNISVIDGATNSVVGAISTGALPFQLAFDSTVGDLFVATQGSPPDRDCNVTVINATTDEAVSAAPLGSVFGIQTMTFDRGNGDVYLGTSNGTYPFFQGNITVFDGGPGVGGESSGGNATSSWSTGPEVYALVGGVVAAVAVIVAVLALSKQRRKAAEVPSVPPAPTERP